MKVWKLSDLANAELVHNDIYQKIQFNANSHQITQYENIMIPISDFQEVIFLDMDLTKLVFTILVPLQILQTIVNFNKLWFFAQNLGKLKL